MSIATRPLMSFAVEVAAPVVVDATRRYIPIVGGVVSGAYSGRVLPGGADWQEISPDGRLDLVAHYAVDIDGHGVVEIDSRGLRHGPPEVLAALARGEAVDPSLYYFRTAVRFRASAPGLQRLNAVIAVSNGRREKSTVFLEICEVL